MTALRTEDEWDVFRRQIEVQLNEYEHAVRDAEDWWRAYQERNKGFRAVRRRLEIGPKRAEPAQEARIAVIDAP